VQLLKEEDEYFVGKTKSVHKAKPKKEEKVYISIDLPPAPRERGRGGRGGRGGDRGGRGDRTARGRGGGRGGSWNKGASGRGAAPANVDVDDEAAFPLLA